MGGVIKENGGRRKILLEKLFFFFLNTNSGNETFEIDPDVNILKIKQTKKKQKQTRPCRLNWPYEARDRDRFYIKKQKNSVK